jgi:hypothetical protein
MDLIDLVFTTSWSTDRKTCTMFSLKFGLGKYFCYMAPCIFFFFLIHTWHLVSINLSISFLKLVIELPIFRIAFMTRKFWIDKLSNGHYFHPRRVIDLSSDSLFQSSCIFLYIIFIIIILLIIRVMKSKF